MLNPRVNHWMTLGTLVALSSIAIGCSDTNKIQVDSVLRPLDNRPPTIVATGPVFPSGPVEVISGSSAPVPYVLVADPVGLDDISVVLFTVDSVVVHRVIARTDTVLPGEFCRRVSYAPLDTFPLEPYIPSFYRGPVNCLMSPAQGGYYRSASFAPLQFYTGSECPAFPRFDTASSFFIPGSISGCYYDGGLLSFQIVPPAVLSTRNLFITYADVEYSAISATVYDGAGASATAKFPKLRLIYTTIDERGAAP